VTAIHTHVCDDEKSLIEDMADWLEARIAATTGPFALALSGGSTPKPLYEMLAQPARAARIDWSRVHLFWGDERFVSYDDPDSNYHMVKLALIDHVAIPAANVHPVPVDGTPESAAQRYAQTLQAYYGAAQLTPQRPLFSVNLLGIGDDGHTASLFPGAPQLEEQRAWTVSSVGQRPEPRISLTFPALASAAAVVFLAAGAKKRDAVARARAQDPGVPSGRVRSQGELFWFLDRAAAGEA
jgi:6-phosphogluconolactonase